MPFLGFSNKKWFSEISDNTLKSVLDQVSDRLDFVVMNDGVCRRVTVNDMAQQSFLRYTTKNHLQGVQEKLIFFTIHCNPSLA